MRGLSNLALYLSPPLLSSFVSKCLKASLQYAMDNSDSDRFKANLKDIRAALSKSGVPEANLVSLANVLEGVYEAVAMDLDGFETFIEVVSDLPNKSIERLSSPALWWEVTPERIGRAASLRTRLALSESTDTPLIWLNELLEVAGRQTGSDYSFLLRNLVEVLESARGKSKQVIF